MSVRKRTLPGHLLMVAGLTCAAVIGACGSPISNIVVESSPTLGPPERGADTVAAETAELELLYRDAVKNGGRLVVWAGGDSPDQQDELVQRLRDRFPLLEVEMIVDLSKYHDLRIDEALAGSGVLPDVAMLQTTFDFDRWSAQKQLLPFKPIGFNAQIPGYAHPNGDYLTAFMFGFHPTYSSAMPIKERPQQYEDFFQDEFADGALALTPPHDDDAVLYIYNALEKHFGVEFLERLRDQRPQWIRGTAVPAFLVGKNGVRGNITGYAGTPGSTAFIPPIDEPFLVWPQRAAIFRGATNVAAGKLLLAFVASREYQSTYDGWRTRSDVSPLDGSQSVSEMPKVDPQAFVRFMADRDHVAAIRKRMECIFGPVVGESPLHDRRLLEILGVNPDRATAPPPPAGPIY